MKGTYRRSIKDCHFMIKWRRYRFCSRKRKGKCLFLMSFQVFFILLNPKRYWKQRILNFQKLTELPSQRSRRKKTYNIADLFKEKLIDIVLTMSSFSISKFKAPIVIILLKSTILKLLLQWLTTISSELRAKLMRFVNSTLQSRSKGTRRCKYNRASK